ncbi:succinylglutamate desuccinylase [Muricauda sp. DJ-13]|uniref:Succinylglutamate desuccinylase n=2 Tax=Croceivirga thetidis TaxID=2721623 RepID=A0ABX1GL29_9FLAO|nr:succinylglutamate desuccinylase [Croceivirga thetidis]
MLICLLGFLRTQGQSNFETSFSDNPRPSRQDIRIPILDSLGNEGVLPISILKGKTKGPIFTIVAGVHGFEYPPIMGVQELLQELDPAKLSGDLIIIPLASVGSFYGREPFRNPQDNVNLNNAFPGIQNGTITQKTAYFITENIIPVTDIFLDIHGGDAPEDLLPFICYYDNKKKPEQTQLAKKLSETSGFEYVVSYPYSLSDDDPAKYMFKQAVQDGKTGVSIEAGKLGNVQKEAVEMVKNGVYNMLRELNMYDHPTRQVENIIRRNHQVYVRSTKQGIFYSSVKAGDKVEEGQLVGYTTDEFGNVLEEYKASISGIILYKLATPPINIGDTVMCISAYL